MPACPFGCQRLETPHAGSHRQFLHHADKPDLACTPHMSAAAQFHRIGLAGLVALARRAHRNDAHFVAILFAEQCHGAGSPRIIDGHQSRLDRRILQDDAIGQPLDFGNLGLADRLGVREVETQPIRRHHRTLLRHMRSEHLSQRLMQQMRGRMVGADGGTATMIDRQRQCRTDIDRT